MLTGEATRAGDGSIDRGTHTGRAKPLGPATAPGNDVSKVSVRLPDEKWQSLR